MAPDIPVMAIRVLPALLLVLLLAAGCGATAPGLASETTTTDKSYAITVEPTTLPEELPPDTCFVGIHRYDVMLLGAQLPKESACLRVAEGLFPDAERLPWSREVYLRSDQVEECELERAGGTLAVLRADFDQEGPRFDWAEETALQACERLERDGWQVRFQEK